MEKRPYIPFTLMQSFQSSPVDLSVPYRRCPLEIHPKCSGFYVPTKESPDNCLLCERLGVSGRSPSKYCLPFGKEK